MLRSRQIASKIVRRQMATNRNEKGVNMYAVVGVPLGIGIGAYLLLEPRFHQTHHSKKHEAKAAKSDPKPKEINWVQLKKDIVEIIESDESYDDTGSYAPILIRLAWHSAGTYKKADNTGGSNGAGQRFAPESDWGANKGLVVARDVLEPLKDKYGDSLSYSDLWSFAGKVAVEAAGGPEIKWKPGRVDFKDSSKCVDDGRLPDATKNAQHLRDIFNRMGFNDQEIVALSGAHCLGKCHVDSSGFVGPWTFSPSSFTNAYFTLLLSEEWVEKKTHVAKSTDSHGKDVFKKVQWKGPKQYTDKATGELMMLPTDMELVKDPEFKKWVEIYAQDQDKFFEDFAKVYSKLLASGVPGQ